MSECKHEFPIRDYECYCSKCNKSMGLILEEENAELRAKLERLKRRLQVLEDVCRIIDQRGAMSLALIPALRRWREVANDDKQ